MKIFYLPDLGEGLAEAEIREWYVKEGDQVKVDQPLVSMETAKAVVDVPSPYEGKITKLHGKTNDVIKTGAPFITFEVLGAASEKPKHSVVGALEESTNTWLEQEVAPQAHYQPQAIKSMPAARLLAKEMGISLEQVQGSGPDGLITVQDVKQQLHINKPTIDANQPLGMLEAEPLRGVRRSMAQSMAQSHQEVVPVSIFEEVDISQLPSQVDLTTQLLLAIAAAAKVEPALNAWFDSKRLARKLWREVNVGLAVDTAEGLFVPVIKDVENKNAAELRADINQYKQAAKERTVLPAELQGATITLSNFGMIAGKYATPIVVPPTVAIVGCGRLREGIVVRQGKLESGKILPLSLTFDHRAATGAEATRFLKVIIDSLQNVKQ